MSIAIVTGASSGIGQGAAIELAKRGFGVILTYGRNKEGGLRTVAEIEELGGKAVALPLDVGLSHTFPAFRQEVTRALDETWGATHFTSLVNNAGFGRMSMFEDTSEELFDEFMRVILKGPFFLTQTLLPLLADNGAIVNTTSSSALVTGVEPGYSAYASAKGGLQVLTRYMAKEFSTRGIRVNSIAPGPTRTRLGDDAFSKYPEVIGPIAAATALGRVGEAEDIGMVVAMLLSEEGRWITGQNIEVSGGHKL
ncbi:SDR family oxidoreductase [Streptomyces sp. NBC_01476]|uniref:SDR family NAD(P)-dependent oxidoreductase n=1 Tax=Streptomyces sp. NBC_01476 TaxID=2903881 RepID=UPI002E37C159|nr:SDR family oxidoreductase [Streptomyces sp. NBC_01476]